MKDAQSKDKEQEDIADRARAAQDREFHNGKEKERMMFEYLDKMEKLN